ncbi:MAG: hypothetical protein JSU87_05075 [Gemmatimonadota bacterium]|nr:MAG: hypothetical protein JSU87_05075 [Gemmatimonadota bacterium]
MSHSVCRSSAPRSQPPAARYSQRLTTIALAAFLSLPTVTQAEVTPIPAFARKYKVSCRLCHNPAPTQTDFGGTFAGNGFRLTSDEAPRDTIDTGDSLLELAADLPLAIRLDGYVVGSTDGKGTDIQAPYNLKILSGGTISSKLSYYLYFFLFERGEVGGIEDAYLYVNDIGGGPVDLIAGQFQVSDPMFKRELRLEYDDYAIYRARVGAQPADLTYDRGVTGVISPDPITISLTVVNGNGKGEAEPDRRLDNDALKNFFGHVTGSVTPYLRLGAMAYFGRQEGQIGAGPELKNDLFMIGADATVSLSELEVNLQYIHRSDDNPTFTTDENTANTNGGFIEAIYRFPGERWYALGLWNYIYTSCGGCGLPLLDARLGGPPGDRYHTLSGGAGYMVRRNVRLLGELGWDIEQEDARVVLGISAAY